MLFKVKNDYEQASKGSNKLSNYFKTNSINVY